MRALSWVKQTWLHRLVIPAAVTCAAAMLQYLIWPYIPGTTWLLLYPALFVSLWIAGLWGGVVATLLACLFGIYFFMPSEGSWTVTDIRYLKSTAIFALFGLSFSLLQERWLQRRLSRLSLKNRDIQTHHDRLILALQTVNAGLWEWDLKTNEVFWSDEVYDLYGLDRGIAPSVDAWLSSLHPDDRETSLASLNEAVEQRREIDLQWRVAHTQDGSERWLSSNGQPLFDEHGNLVAYRGIILNITQRKRHNAEKQATESRYRTLMDQAAPDAIYIHDHDARIIEVNQRACEIDGYSRSEALSLTVMDIDPEFDLAKAQRAWLQLEEGSTLTLTSKHRRKDGCEYPVEIRIGLIIDQGKRLYIAFVRDISERVAAEAALRKSEREFRMLAEAMPQIVWTSLPDGSTNFVNQLWVEYTGAQTTDSYGNGWADLIHPDDIESVLAAWSHALETQTEYTVQARLRRKDGEYRWWLTRSLPIIDANGAIEKWLGTCTDIHALKETQYALQASEARYRQLFDANPLPLWICDRQTQSFIDINQAAIEQYGYSRDEFRRMTMADLTNTACESSSDLAADLNERHGIERHRGKDGQTFWADVISHPIAINGMPADIVLARDVTRQLQAETQLKQSEARWQFALEGSNQGVWDWDIQKGSVFLSKHWKAMLGLAEHEISDRLEEWSERVHPDDFQAVMLDIERHFRGETGFYENEHRLKTRDGGYIWILARGVVVERDDQGQPIRMIGTQTDITEHRTLLDKLRQSEYLTRAIMDSLMSSIVVLDEQGVVINTNRSWQHLLEDSAFDSWIKIPLGGNYLEACKTANETEALAIYRGLQAVLSGEETQFSIDYPQRLHDGTVRWFRMDAMPLAGNVKGLVTRHVDITQRKLIENELREKERLLADSQTVAHIGSWMMDLPSRQIQWSDEAHRLFGLPPDHDSVFDVPRLLQRIHADDRAALLAWLDQCESGQTMEGIEFRIIGADEVSRWLLCFGALETDAGGVALRMIGTIQDVTERKQMQGLLQASLNRLQLFVEHAPASIALFDRSMRYLAYSRRWQDDYGVAGRDLTNLCHYDLFPDMPEHWKRAHQRGLAGEIQRNEEDYFLSSDGTGHWLRWEVRPWYDDDGSVGGIIIFAEDISERKQAEAQLKLRGSALEAAANAILITDAGGVVEWINPAFTTLTGYTSEEVIGRRLGPLVKSDHQQPEFYKSLWHTIASGNVWHGELINRRKDGSIYIEEQIITPVPDEHDIIRHYIAVKQDISARKHNEAELARYRDHLEQLVAQRTAELETARREAERLSEVKSTFLANMSHEIRTPMNAVMGFCHLLEQRELQHETRQLVAKIHSAGQTLLSIINDILDFSKIEAGRMEIESSVFHLQGILDQLAEMAAGFASHKPIEVIIAPAPGIDALVGDGLRLQQVLVNLLSNAIKFTEQGEVELKVEVKSTAEQTATLRFAVRDTGIGISEEKQREIFSAFTQADTSIGRRFGGTGLGLAICQQLVKLMGGELHVDSTEGSGSEFWFVLSLGCGSAHALETASKRLRVLAVDDNACVRNALHLIFDDLGWQGDIVDSGSHAISEIVTQSENDLFYDVVLLDWRMPVQDGLTSARLIRETIADIPNATSPVILIMASDDARDGILADSDKPVIDGILSKPITASALTNALSRTIEGSQDAEKATQPAASDAEAGQITGIRILVVDDSDINREVAQHILQARGATVSLATDGQDALHWLNTHPDAVDIVLMDVQMPVMDGYTATRMIRQNPLWRTLPVIALTAGAFQALRDAAYDAGMTDFVAKPFDVDQLVKTILQHVAPGTASVVVQTETRTAVQHSTERSGIDLEAGMTLWGNETTYRTYLNKFVQNYFDAARTIEQQLSQNDRQAAQAMAHKLKGVAGSLALPDVMRLAQLLDTQLKNRDAVGDTLCAFQRAIDDACSSIRDWNDKVVEQEAAIKIDAPPADTESVIKTLTALLEALDFDNPDFTDLFMNDLLGKLPDDDYRRIYEQLADFDFKAARTSVQTVLDRLKSEEMD